MKSKIKLKPPDQEIDEALTELSKVNELKDYELPKVSIIIPTFNCAQSITVTLESILNQEYPDYEIIIVDGGSMDRTVEVVKGFHHERISIYSVSGYQRYEMLNKGITQAAGDYINLLFPGDYYISRETLKHMMGLAVEGKKPHLIFCGTLLRDGKSEVKILRRHLSLRLLRKGQQPTSLQSMWFRGDVFDVLGKFNTTYNLRGGYEFLCRFCLKSHMRAISTTWVLTDYDLRLVTKQMIVCHFWETMRTIFNYFGLKATVVWLFIQKDMIRFGKLWFRSIKHAFVGR